MKTILLLIMTQLVKFLTSKDFVDAVQKTAVMLLDMDIPGDEKKQRLMDQLKEMYGAAGDAIAGYAPHIVNLVIEVVVAKLKARVNE